MRLPILLSLLPAALGAGQTPPAGTVPNGACRPNGMGRPDGMASRDLPGGHVMVNIVSGAAGKVDAEVVLWTPASPQAGAVRMTMRWEAHAPAGIDFDHGLVMFDSDRLWARPPYARVPKKLTVELRANRDGPWEQSAALRGAIALQYGVRLAADWADVRAMASAQPQLYLITRSKGAMVDLVALERRDFRLPLADINAFRAQVRARAAGPDIACDPNTEIIVT